MDREACMVLVSMERRQTSVTITQIEVRLRRDRHAVKVDTAQGSTLAMGI